jgi:diguanylate cyclase
MSRFTPEQLAVEWRESLHVFPVSVMQGMRALAEKHQDQLASHFYEQMLSDPVASQFLNHDQVKIRLHASMRRWITGLIPADADSDPTPFVALQTKVGEVHARIGLPVHLVLRGARLLKQRFLELLRIDSSFPEDSKFHAARLAGLAIDLSMEAMSQAYSGAHDRNARAEESYRLFSVTQNIAAEKERQRAAHLDWENQLMFDLAVGAKGCQLPRLSASEFGVWFRHKGAHAFQGTAETRQILETMQHIDDVLLPLFDLPDGDQSERVLHLRDLREQSKSIGFHLDRLFELYSELEAGRDVLTRLLSRKFLPVVLNKEIAYARNNGTPFAVLAMDIDHFKDVNDNYGHEAGDTVLQQFASVLTHCSRSGDYTFRLGGEEFLVLLVDTDQSGALRAAEKLRSQVEAEDFRLSQDRTLRMTVSIGVAIHNGHPDYQHMLRRADEALYRAKHEGRNRVTLSES